MKNLVLTILAGISLAFAYSRYQERNRWKGWVYPDRNNLAIFDQLGEFESLEACRQSALNHPRYYGNKSDYECGSGCEAKGSFGLSVCNETSR